MTSDTADHTAHPADGAPRVAVRGEAHLDVEPDLARIGITVRARGNDRRAALDDLTRRNTQVADLVHSYGDAVERLETGAFSIAPELTRRGKGERVRAYHGTVRLTADLTDFTALGELTTRLADLDMTAVDGPWWRLRPTSPAHAEARRRAVHDAVRRAREYAGALGSTLTGLIDIADTGTDTTVRTHTPLRALAAPGGPAADDVPALDLEPQRQTVHAQIDARFTMTPPDLEQ
jgi:uncharacterized protein YggE